MCFTIFPQAPWRPGWYHACPFHICTCTLRVKEKRRRSLRTSQGVEPNVKLPQHPQAPEFLWSTPLWNRTNEMWNQQLHHYRKKTHPKGKAEAIPSTLIFFPVAHRASWGRDSRFFWGTSPVKDVYFSSGFILCKADTIQPKWLKAVLAIDIFLGKCQCLHMYVYYVYIYIYVYIHVLKIHVYIHTIGIKSITCI